MEGWRIKGTLGQFDWLIEDGSCCAGCIRGRLRRILTLQSRHVLTEDVCSDSGDTVPWRGRLTFIGSMIAVCSYRKVSDSEACKTVNEHFTQVTVVVVQ